MQRSSAVGLLLSGFVALACKASPGDTDTDASSSTGTTSPTSITSVTDPTTSGTTTGEPTTSGTTAPASTGSSSGEAPTTSGTSTTAVDLTTGSTTGDRTTGPPADCVQLACDGSVYACGDCMDNDGDGKYDGADPECVSPCDDKEDTFATGLPGDNMDPCKQDCFFDGNSGGGAGDCAWNLKCDPKSPGGDKCPYDPNFDKCPEMQDEECVATCQVPNGCDCFGCCSVQVDGVNYDIYIGDPDCNLASIDTCQQCTPNPDCLDACEPDKCEVCFGRELPEDCEEAGCDNEMPCEIDDMGGSDCPADMFCQTGCCQPIVPG